MPPEDVTDLDPKIAGIVERAVQRVREELLQKLQHTNAEVEALTRRVGPAVPAAAEVEAVAPEEAVEPRVAEPETPRIPLEEMVRAAAHIEACQTQKDVLTALLAEVSGLASRAALFLTRPDAALGWAGHGFDNGASEISSLRVDYADSEPWSRLAAGRGAVRLSADECAELCREIDGSEPAQGLLVPFILGGQVAAGLYADRLDDEAPIPDAAIQILTLIGSQTVQSLPLRERPATATLRYAEEAPAEEPGLPLWQAGAVAGAAAAAVTKPQPPAEIAEIAELEMEPEEAIELEEPIELDTDIEIAADAGLETDLVLETDLEDFEPPLEPVEESGFEVELADVATLAPAPESLDADETETELLSAPAELDEVDLETEEPAIEVAEPAEPEAAEPAPPRPAAPEVIPAVPKPPVEAPAPVAAAPREAATAPPAPPAAEKAEIQAGTEIAPPPDLEGPGWAFTTTRISREATDEAIHEEARRLARLLVTEIKLYNEEQVDEGRRNQDVYHRLKEDIDRSRQIFEERIDEKVRRTTDYFHEELVRVLCGGDPQLLGV